MVRGLYAGVSAGIFRQVVYGMPRMALYSTLLDKFKPPAGEVLSFWKKVGLGFTAGGVASFFGTPSEVCLVRMTADQNAPKEVQRG